MNRWINQVPDFYSDSWREAVFKGVNKPVIFYAKDPANNQDVPIGRYRFYLNDYGEIGFDIFADYHGAICKFWEKSINYFDEKIVTLFYIACIVGSNWEVRRLMKIVKTDKDLLSIIRGEIIRSREDQKMLGVKIFFKLFNGEDCFLPVLL
jgi:hypothetical protein